MSGRTSDSTPKKHRETSGKAQKRDEKTSGLFSKKDDAARQVKEDVAPQIEDDVTQQIENLQSRMEDLHSRVLFSSINDELEDIDSALAHLPIAIEQIRTRGYVFKGYLEKKTQVLQEQWDELRRQVEDESDQRRRALSREADSLAQQVSSLRARRGSAARTMASQIESTVSALEGKVKAAESNIRGMFDTLEGNMYQTRRQIEGVEWLLDQIDGASFRLYPHEAAIDAVEARYLTDEKEGPEGILYLTDQRLLFEQKEEVVKERKLLIFTEKELVQELLLDVPIGQVEEVRESEKGFLIGKKEILDLAFFSQAPVREATFHLKGADSEVWKALIGRVLSGEIDRERTVAVEEAVVEAVREAPTKCPACGATITQEIVRGMQTITCEYCGQIIRL